MGFLHKLWDETLAGPAPESGLGKLRKYGSFTASRSAPAVSLSSGAAPVNITRSITIVKNNPCPRLARNISVETAGLAPESPVGSSTPGTPTSPTTPPVDFKKFTRRRTPADPSDRAEPRSPTVYDWMVISALDR